LKQVQAWLNEDEYQRFRKKAQSLKLCDYAFLKKIVLEAINGSREGV